MDGWKEICYSIISGEKLYFFGKTNLPLHVSEILACGSLTSNRSNVNRSKNNANDYYLVKIMVAINEAAPLETTNDDDELRSVFPRKFRGVACSLYLLQLNEKQRKATRKSCISPHQLSCSKFPRRLVLSFDNRKASKYSSVCKRILLRTEVN